VLQTISIQNLKNFEYHEGKFDLKLGPACQSQTPPNRTHRLPVRAPARHRGRSPCAVGDHRLRAPPQATQSPLSPRRCGPLTKRSRSPLTFSALSLSPASLLRLLLSLPMNHLDKSHRSHLVVSYFDAPRGAPASSCRPPSNAPERADVVTLLFKSC
jgi:hypothetical protein